MIEVVHAMEDPLGFHARPVMLVSAEAAKWKSRVTVHNGRLSADAADPIALMGLQARQGDELVFQIEGSDEEDASEFIAHMLRGL